MKKKIITGIITGLLFVTGTASFAATAETLPRGSQVTIQPINGRLQVSICGAKVVYAEVYSHAFTAPREEVSINVVKKKCGLCYTYEMDYGQGTNFKFCNADNQSRWNLFSGKKKEFWEDSGVCTVPVNFGGGNKGAEIVSCSDTFFAGLLSHKNTTQRSVTPGTLVVD